MTKNYTQLGAIGLGKAIWRPDNSFINFYYYDCPYYFDTSLPYYSFFRYWSLEGGQKDAYLPDPTDPNYNGLSIQVRYSGIWYNHNELKIHCGNAVNKRIKVGGNYAFLHTISLKSGGVLDFLCKDGYWEVWEWYQIQAT